MKIIIMLLWSFSALGQYHPTKVLSVKDYVDSLERVIRKNRIALNYLEEYRGTISSKQTVLQQEIDRLQFITLNKMCSLSKIVKNYYKMKGNKSETDSLSQFQARIAGRIYSLTFKPKSL